MADPLSIAAGVTGILGFAGVTLTKGYAVLRVLSEGRNEIQRLLGELSQLTGILVAIDAQEKEAKKNVGAELVDSKSISKSLDSILAECRKTLRNVWEILEKLEKSRRVVSLVKWQVLEPQVKTLIEEIEHYKNPFTLCLGIDAR